MAVERTAEFAVDLGAIVQARLDSFSNTRKSIQAKQEADFQRRISDENLSYESQLDFRNKQLTEENAKDYPDAAHVSELQSDVSNLKKQIRYQNLRNRFNESYTQYKEGKTSIESIISSLQSDLAGETDPTMKAELQGNLDTLRVQKTMDDQNILANREALAKSDKSISLYDSLITDESNKRNDALLSGNQELISFYDTKIYNLKAARESIAMENSINDLDLSVLQQGSSAMSKFGMLDSKVNSADKNTPIFVNGVKWNSAYEYWNAQKNSYLAGSGSGLFADYFSELSNENKISLKVLSSKSPNGEISSSDLSNVTTQLNTLSSRPDLQPYLARLDGVKNDIMTTATTLNANAIISDYGKNEDYTTAMSKLTSLEQLTGVNLSTTKSDLIQKQAKLVQEGANIIAQGGTATKVSPENIAGMTPKGLSDVESGITPPPAPSVAGYYRIGNDVYNAQGKYISMDEAKQLNIVPLLANIPQKSITSTPTSTPTTTPKLVVTPTPTPTSTLTPTPVSATPAVTPAPTGYTGSSIVDYLVSVKQPSDYTSRSTLAKQKGITNYTGTAAQNTQLLKILRGF